MPAADTCIYMYIVIVEAQLSPVKLRYAPMR